MHCLSLWGYQSYMWYTGICADKNSYIQNKNKLNPTSRQDSELSLLGSRNAGEPGKCSTQGVERLREGMLFKKHAWIVLWARTRGQESKSQCKENNTSSSSSSSSNKPADKWGRGHIKSKRFHTAEETTERRDG